MCDYFTAVVLVATFLLLVQLKHLAMLILCPGGDFDDDDEDDGDGDMIMIYI